MLRCIERRVSAPSRLITTTGLHTSRRLLATASRRPTTQSRVDASGDKKGESSTTEKPRPHVVTGLYSGNELRWETCDLAKVLLTPEKIAAHSPSTPFKDYPDTISLPNHMNYGIGPSERKLLFESLPNASAKLYNLSKTESKSHARTPHELEKVANVAVPNELKNLELFSKLVDLRNASAKGIEFVNRRRVIEAFSEPGGIYDSGRSEVQAALLTMRIRNLWDHLLRAKKDISNRRSLRRLVHERAKILRYLKRKDRNRYYAILERLAIEPGAVEGELLV